MKHLIFIAIMLSVVSITTAQDCKAKKDDAIVEQYSGVYIFVDCKPKAEYKFLGTVNSGSGFGKAMMGTPEYDQKKMKLIEKVKKDYPQADGIIIHFVKGGKDSADAIKFSE